MKAKNKKKLKFLIGPAIVVLIVIVLFFFPRAPSVCSDGTAAGSCSVEKPKLCYDGATPKLVDSCSSCGCPLGEVCAVNQSCTSCVCPSAKSEVCVITGGAPWHTLKKTFDNLCVAECQGFRDTDVVRNESCKDCGYVQNGACSITKPRYCNDGELIELCTVCGCPSGKTCMRTGKCA